jgi:eukaryotic-like serine/threonine-protein kinase
MDTLAGRYRLLAQVGRGGMGTVWRARDERLDRDVAVKVLHSWVADDPRLRRRFEEEARMLASLQHAHVVRLYDVARHDGNAVLVMELVDGDSVAALVERGRRLPWSEAARLCGPVAGALAYAHARGIVHRDLTAANVLVEAASGRVVVSDFGLARLLRASAETPGSTGIAGTPEYWSPEQAAGRTPDAATDVYALGCLLFRLVSGRLPFEGDDRLAAGLRRAREDAPPLAAHAPNVPVAATALVDAMLARRPRARPTAREVAQILGVEPASPAADVTARVRRPRAEAPATMPAPTRAPVTGLTAARRPKPYRAVKRGRGVAATLVFAVVLALSGGGVYALASKEPPGIDAPQVVGTTLAQARRLVATRAEQEGVEAPRVRVTGRRYSERLPAGAILAQSRPPGEHLAATGTLGVRLSLGTPWAVVPDTAGHETRDALRALAASGFTPVRRYGPTFTTAAWHVAKTVPPAGSRIRRPAKVIVLVSTGRPRVAVPDIRGDDSSDGLDVLEEAGLAAHVEEVPSTSADPGTILELDPPPGARMRMGATVSVVVAREPRWEVVTSVDGTGDYTSDTLVVDSGDRVVLQVEDTSFLGLFGTHVDVSWDGDVTGTGEAGSGDEVVLLEPADAPRRVAFTLRPADSAYWTLRVEKIG